MRNPLGCLALLAAGICSVAPLAGADDAGLAFFEKKICPALVMHCYECHSSAANKLGGNLLLDRREGLQKGGDSGPAIEAGKPDASLLIAAVRYTNESVKMPPKGKLPAETIADFEAWVKMGAPDPRDQPPPPKTASSWEETLRQRRSWWSLQSVSKPAVPQPKDAAWSEHPVDQFVLARLEEQGLTPAEPAPPRTLARRLSLVLTGLPPAAQQVEAFLQDGKPFTESKNPTAKGNRQWLKSPWSFRRFGQSGLPVSELFPHLAACADDLAVIRSMKADLPIHSTGVLFLHTGSNNAGRPSLGSWVNYGLGSENRNLPGFVVLSFGVVPCGGLENFSSGFLPGNHQATSLAADGTPIDNIQPADPDARVQRTKLALLRAQDGAFSRSLGSDDSIESAIKNYEMAYRMQSLVPDVLDLSRETAATQKLYGIDSSVPSQRLYGIQCLRARRLIESGVRFVEITCPPGASNGTWDQHGNLKKGHEKNALDTDQAIAALIQDLKARGLFDETLIVWAGEFGRTPHSAGRDGRDHHPEGFTVWLAGGGTKGGALYGATDELGMHAAENVCTMHDLHATILHLLGIDHTRLTFRHSGRDFRLTDVHGNVVREVIA